MSLSYPIIAVILRSDHCKWSIFCQPHNDLWVSRSDLSHVRLRIFSAWQVSIYYFKCIVSIFQIINVNELYVYNEERYETADLSSWINNLCESTTYVTERQFAEEMQYVLPCLRSLMKIMTVNFSISRRFWSGKCLCCHSRDFLIEFQMVGRQTGGDKKKRQRAEDINNSNQESAELKSSLVEILSSFSSLFSSPYFSICCLGWRDYLGLPDPPVPCPGKHSALRYTLIFS